jgi:hypothetical protein
MAEKSAVNDVAVSAVWPRAGQLNVRELLREAGVRASRQAPVQDPAEARIAAFEFIGVSTIRAVVSHRSNIFLRSSTSAIMRQVPTHTSLPPCSRPSRCYGGQRGDVSIAAPQAMEPYMTNRKTESVMKKLTIDAAPGSAYPAGSQELRFGKGFIASSWHRVWLRALAGHSPWEAVAALVTRDAMIGVAKVRLS